MGIHRRATMRHRASETIDSPAHFHVGDAAELVKRVRPKAPVGCGPADQELPDLCMRPGVLIPGPTS